MSCIGCEYVYKNIFTISHSLTCNRVVRCVACDQMYMHSDTCTHNTCVDCKKYAGKRENPCTVIKCTECFEWMGHLHGNKCTRNGVGSQTKSAVRS